MNTQTLALVSGLAFLAWLLLSASAIMNIINIRRTPTTWISALPDKGRVEVLGTAGQKILESPIKKSPCVLWQLEVEEEKKGSIGSRSWSTVYKKSSSEPFEVYDDTGRIQIQPEGADLILGEDAFVEDPDTQTTSLLSSMGIETTNWLGSQKNLRVHERLIAPEEQVYVFGEIKQSDGSRSIACFNDVMIISDWGESDTLNKLYQQLAMNAGIVLVGAIVLVYNLI